MDNSQSALTPGQKSAINTFTDKWLADEENTGDLERWIEGVLATEAKSSGIKDWTDRPESFTLIVLIFTELKNSLVSSGFYSFRKKRLELMMQTFLDRLDESVIIHAVTQHMSSNAYRQFKQDFSTLKLPEANDETEPAEEWLQQWMLRPHFSRYRQFTESIKSKELRKEIRDKTINKMLEEQYHPPTRRTLYQVLLYHREFSTSILLRLQHADHITASLTREERLYYDALGKSHPDRLIRHYMLWVEQTAENYSSRHQTELAYMLESLQKLTKHSADPGMYTRFINLLEHKYKPRRGFIKELRNNAPPTEK